MNFGSKGANMPFSIKLHRVVVILTIKVWNMCGLVNIPLGRLVHFLALCWGESGRFDGRPFLRTYFKSIYRKAARLWKELQSCKCLSRYMYSALIWRQKAHLVWASFIMEYNLINLTLLKDWRHVVFFQEFSCPGNKWQWLTWKEIKLF